MLTAADDGNPGEHDMQVHQGTVDLTREFAYPSNAVFAAWSQREAQNTWGHPGAGWHMSLDRFSFEVG